MRTKRQRINIHKSYRQS